MAEVLTPAAIVVAPDISARDLDGTISSSRPHYERIPVTGGEIIAYDGGTAGFDFSVHDARVILPGFVRPETYEVEPWKIHTIDPYDVFVEPVRSQLLAKNVRQVEPLGGTSALAPQHQNADHAASPKLITCPSTSGLV